MGKSAAQVATSQKKKKKTSSGAKCVTYWRIKFPWQRVFHINGVGEGCWLLYKGISFSHKDDEI